VRSYKTTGLSSFEGFLVEDGNVDVELLHIHNRAAKNLDAEILLPQGRLLRQGRRCGNYFEEIQALQKQIREQTEILKLLLVKQGAQDVGLQAIKEELASVREELALAKEENKKLHERIDDLTALVSVQSSPRQSYAEVARTPPTSQPSNVQTLNSTPSRLTDTLGPRRQCVPSP
jgi:predicted nuclease with TOPRIM domain